MKPRRRSMLSRLDDTLRWTGIPARVADQMSGAPSVSRKVRPLRWIPIWPIAIACAVFILSLTRLFPLNLVALLPSLGAAIVATVPLISMHGPLGNPSAADDARQAALRTNSFLFCLGLLAGFNCLGQPLLAILAVLQHWQAAQSVSVAGSAFMLNATLFGCLPTLYASWHLRQLPED